MKSVIRERVELCRKGEHPNCIGKMESGWLVVSKDQPLGGYCLLLADPVVGSLNELSISARGIYCQDMIRAGDALMKVTGAYRINYETWGNVDPSLHTHIVSRYSNEPEAKRRLQLREAYNLEESPKFDPVASQDFLEKMRAELSIK